MQNEPPRYRHPNDTPRPKPAVASIDATLGRLAIRAVRFEPEADALLKSCVEMIPQRVVEKIREQLGNN